MRRWKLSETDLYSRTKWVDYSRAKDEMFVHTDIPEAPWYVVEADDQEEGAAELHRAPAESQIPWEPKPLPDDRDPATVRWTRATCGRRASSTPTCPTTPSDPRAHEKRER